MKNQNLLLPSTKTNFIDPESGELKIRYRPGYPRSYRFDASRGVFSINGENHITKKGESMTFIPVGYRLFRDDILGYGLKKWAEFFFINEEGHLCNLLFHGYSVENLERRTMDLFYDNVNLCEVALTSTPVEKVKQSGEGKGSKYFIAEFSYNVLDKDKRKHIKELGEALPIWRAETLTGDAMVEISVSYRPPIHLPDGNGKQVAQLGETADSTAQLGEAPQHKAA